MELNTSYSFKLLDLNGLKLLVEFAILEGWNPGPHDAEAFFKSDPEGFYGYFKNEVLIGGGSLVSYGGQFGFMGFFIIVQAYRGQGLGRKLWTLRRDTLLGRLNPGATLGMDGVVAMQSFYNKGGFVLAYKDERYEKLGSPYPVSPNISAINSSDFETIVSYDTPCFGFERKPFLKAWLSIPALHTFKYVADGKLIGYACMRPVHTGFKICPLFADEAHVAEALYRACLNQANGKPVYIDVPTANTAAVAMVKKHRAKYIFECGRMYHGKPPKLELEKVFGVTSFELG